MLPLVDDPTALHRELRAMEVDHLLVVHERQRVPLVRDATFRGLFRTVAGGERFELFAVAPEPS